MSRNITVDAIHHFGLKYCPSHTTINDKRFFTKDRVIIPIKNIAGEMVSWQGRDITGRSRTRYLFPPMFKGAEYLYNIDGIPKHADYVIIAEGCFDCFGWWMAGAKNVVATFGKKISEAQVDMLRYINPTAIFMAWDTDHISKKYEFCEKYSYLFKDIRIVDLQGRDADEMTRADLMSALVTAKPYDWSEKVLTLLG
jgi:DNA primase